MPLLEIKDFGPPAAYGEDKELTLNKKSPPLTPPLSLKGRGRRIFDPSPNLSHTARSFTRLNSVSSVQLVSLGEE